MIRTVVFDLGGVLIDWNPRYLYRKLLDSEEEVEWFLTHVCTAEWNSRQDAGRPFSEAVRMLVERHPEHASLIRAYQRRWPETLGGAIEGTVSLLEELRRRRIPLYALSNWSSETFPEAWRRFEFLEWFDGILISGEVGVIKPDSRIYRELISRFSLREDRTLFIDDSRENVEAASRLGFEATRFQNPEQLTRVLKELRLLS